MVMPLCLIEGRLSLAGCPLVVHVFGLEGFVAVPFTTMTLLRARLLLSLVEASP